MSESNSNKENAKKIVISVFSTVIAAFIIFYFIDQKKPKNERKEATLRAWASYNQNKDIFQKTMNEMGTALQAGQGDLKTAMNHSFTEIDLTVSNFENIKTQGNVDDRLFSLVDVKINFIKEMKTLYGAVFEKLIQIEQSNLSPQETETETQKLVSEFADQITSIKDRDKTRVAILKDGLCKDYGGAICDK